MNKQQLAAKIWASANKMRSKIEANEYKDYILGFIFYKYLSDKEENYLRNNDWTDEDFPELKEEDGDVVLNCQQNIGYFISYDNLFSTWLKKGKDFDVSNVRDAISAFNRLISSSHKKVFEKIFDTLQTGLSKLGDSAGTQTKAINELLQLIKDIPTVANQDYDVLGFIYEYLISNFAASAGKKAGEFYTPHEVAILMSEIVAHHLKDRSTIKIYDPTSGSGSLLINIGSSVAKHINSKDNIQYYAQELKENTYNLTRMNLVMRDILPHNIIARNGDTLEEDWPYFDESAKETTYNPLYVDAVVSNPPYSQMWDSTNKDTDPRYAEFGLAPKSKADYAFLLHDLYHVKPDGIMAIVLPHGVLFRGGEEEKIRTNLIERNHIDAIIGLPANIFFGTGIPTIVIILRQRRDRDDVLIVDASKDFIKDGKSNRLRACDIKKIADAVINKNDNFKFSRKVTRQEIRDNEYNLNIPRYVDSSNDAEPWDIYATMFGGIPNNEIDVYAKCWDALPTLRNEIFKSDNTPYSSLVVEDVKSVISQNSNVLSYVEEYQSVFSNFPDFLKKELLDNMLTLKVTQQESRISADIFARLSNIALVDRYQAYQILDDQWINTATDLEIIQTEGFEATRKVDPNMVIKKKDGKDTEVQEGWVGRIIPFELVQQTILKEEADALRLQEMQLSQIISDLDEIYDGLTEEEKMSRVYNDAKKIFVNTKEFANEINRLIVSKSDEDKVFCDKLERARKLINKEKDLKKVIKKADEKLQILTKKTIEKLTDDDVMMLLELKWITPLYSSLIGLPDTIFRDFATQVDALANKYAVTYIEIEKSIKESEQSLATLIDDLEGNEFDTKGLKEFQTLLIDGKYEQ